MGNHITHHLAFQEAFDVATYGSSPDVEFAAVQAWFMHKKSMSEEEAYTQARFRMRDLVRQKRRVWECYRRSQFLDQTQRNDEGVKLIDGWIGEVEKEIQKHAREEAQRRQSAADFKQSAMGMRGGPSTMRGDG